MNICVAAPAIRTSGALSILNQFLVNIPYNSKYKYFVFIDTKFVIIPNPNIKYLFVDTTKWINRIIWDKNGIKKWSKRSNIEVDLIISFQNIGVNFSENIPQLIYYHNVIPLLNKKWNFWIKDERLFFFYKYFYPFFVKRSINAKTEVVVQLPFIKERFVKKFSIDESRVHIVRPDIHVSLKEKRETNCQDNYIHLIYPATPFSYKNHIILVEALNIIKEVNATLLKQIRIHFTFDESDYPILTREIVKNKLQDSFLFDGMIPHDDLLLFYKSMTALLFPSCVESFGLPLLEAAGIGIPILVSDLPYARDVIGEYEGGYFIPSDDSAFWADKIAQVCVDKREYQPLVQQNISNWESFFELIDKLIK